MSKYKATVTVLWEATGEIEIEADDEEHARQLAEDFHDGIGVYDADEIEASVDSIECIDEDGDDEDVMDYVPKEQMALPTCEGLVAGVVRR